MSKKSQSRRSLKKKTILHIYTGSIAAYKTPELTQALRDEGARVLCLLTEGAKKFVTTETVHAISGEPVFGDMWANNASLPVLHTSLAEQADLILVAPASANFIARAAVGLADELAACVLLASKAPVVLVPAMNDAMYQHPLTQANLKTLSGIGHRILKPIKGHLVCGKHAIGHIPSNKAIVDAVYASLSKR